MLAKEILGFRAWPWRSDHVPLFPCPDSDSEEEDAHFFSVDESGVPQPSVPEPRNPRAQSTFSTLVTVLKGRITVLCETKVSEGRGGGLG